VAWSEGNILHRCSYIVAAIILMLLPASLNPATHRSYQTNPWADVIKGARLLFGNVYLRFALAIEFLSAIVGAQILVNSVGHIKSALSLDDKHYGWIMSAFAAGAAVRHFFQASSTKQKAGNKL
jgi:MFS transporter, NRE family, putaive nickel resistance protein